MGRKLGYQVYIDRGEGWTLDGCWGSEYGLCSSAEVAEDACQQLAEIYPDATWGYEEPDGTMHTVHEAVYEDNDE